MPETSPKYNLKEAFEIHNQGGGAGRITLEEFARLVPKSDWGMTYLEMAEKYGWGGSDKLKKAEAEGKIKSLKNGGAMAPIIPTYYKSKGTPIYRDTTDAPPRILKHGGPHNPVFNAVNAVEDMVANHYQSMSLADYRKLQNNLKLKKAKYDAEHTRVDNVINSAHELGLKLGTNEEIQGKKLKAKGKEYVYNPGTYDNDLLKDRTIQVDNPQDWEAIGMDFVNDPNNYLNNLKKYDEQGNLRVVENPHSGIVPLDSEGNPYPELEQGMGCIGSQCGIYSTAGATNISDYKTGYGNQVAKAGDPIFKQLSNKFWDANNQAALTAAGFQRVEKGAPIRKGTLARIEDSYTTEENPSYGHTVMVNKVNADGTGVDFNTKDGFIENPGKFSSGIRTSSPYNSYKNRLHYYNYVGNEPQLKKEYEDLLAQEKAYEKYNQPINLPLIKPEFKREGPKEIDIIKERVYPDTRRGRKQKKRDLASNPSFKKGGFVNSVKKQVENSRKFVNGGETEDIGKGMAYEFWKNRTQPVDKFGRPNANYQGPTTFRSLSNQVNAPIPTKADELTNQYGYDYKKTYNESGTPHYYTRKEGADSWIDLETEGNKNSLAAVKALAWGDDTSYIGTEAHRNQIRDQLIKNENARIKGLSSEEYTDELSSMYFPKKEQPATKSFNEQDYKNIESDFGSDVANLMRSGVVGSANSQQSKMPPKKLVQGQPGYQEQQTALNQGYQTKAGAAYSNKLNQEYVKNISNELINKIINSKMSNIEKRELLQNPEKLQNLVINYEGWKTSPQGGENDAYSRRGAVKSDDFIINTDGTADYRAGANPVVIDGGVDMLDEEWITGVAGGKAFSELLGGTAGMIASKFKSNPIVQATGKTLTQPLLTNTAPQFSKYMLSPLKIADVAGGVYGVNQFTDSDSTTRQSIRDYQQGKGSFGDAAFNTAMSVLSATPVGAEIFRSGYGNLIGGLNAIRKVPQVRDFMPGMKQVLKREAKFKDLFNTQKYTRFTKPGQVESKTGNYWYNRVDGTDLGKYQKGADQATDLVLTDASASQFNVAKIQDRINKGKAVGSLQEKAAKRSIAPINDPKMVAYRKTITDPEKRKMFDTALQNPDKYWKLPGYTDDIGELIAKAPANADELNLSKELFKDIKAYDAKNWKSGYSLLEDFSGSYGGAKSKALRQSKKAIDYLGKYSSKLGKIGKTEQGGLDLVEGNFIGYDDKGFELKAE